MSTAAASLYFEAETLDGEQTIHLQLHHIANPNTIDDVFYFTDGLVDPVPCRYSSLRLLDATEVFEAKLRAL